MVVVESGQLVKQDKPTKWVTVEGRRIPITPKKPVAAEPVTDPMKPPLLLEIADHARQVWGMGKGNPTYVRHETKEEALDAFNLSSHYENKEAPAGWYDFWQHEVHLVSPAVITGAPGLSTTGAYLHAAIHESMHATTTGRALIGNMPANWTEGLNELATRWIIREYDIEIGEVEDSWTSQVLSATTSYEVELEGLCGAAYIIADGSVDGAVEVLRDLIEECSQVGEIPSTDPSFVSTSSGWEAEKAMERFIEQYRAKRFGDGRFAMSEEEKVVRQKLVEATAGITASDFSHLPDLAEDANGAIERETEETVSHIVWEVTRAGARGVEKLAKQDKPIRWITVGGKRVPITPTKSRAVKEDKWSSQLLEYLPEFYADTMSRGAMFLLPDHRAVFGKDKESIHEDFVRDLLLSDSPGLGDPKAGQQFDLQRTQEEKHGWYWDKYYDILVRLYGRKWIRVVGNRDFELDTLDRASAEIIDEYLMKVLPTRGNISVWGKPASFTVSWDDYEAAGFSIYKVMQQQRRLPESMRRLSTSTDLLKISQAELDIQTTRLRRDAAYYAEIYAPTFDDASRRIFREELESSFLSGFKEILQRPGRGPKGTIGRTRMRQAITEMLYNTTRALSGRITYLALENETNARLQEYLAAYERGRMTYRQLEDTSRSLLKFSYDQAIAIGKRTELIHRKEALGETVSDADYIMPVTVTPADRDRALEELEDEYQYLTGFLEEARRRKEEKVPFGPYIHWRGKLYSQALYGLEQYGFISELSPLDTIHWVINPTAESCEDCIRLAAGGPYTRETLPTVPRQGRTQCLMNCQCHLEVAYAAMAA